MSKKYELSPELFGYYQIKALIDIPRHGVKAGDLGGQVQGEHNLSQEGDCWIKEGSALRDDARVEGNAIIQNNSIIGDNARVSGDAVVDNCSVMWYSVISGNAVVIDCLVEYYTQILDNSYVKKARLGKNCILFGYTNISIDVPILRAIDDLQGEITQKDYLLQGPAVSSGRYSLGMRTLNGIVITTGCFKGGLDKYLAAIEKTHKDSPECLYEYRQFHQNFVDHFRK